MTDTSADLDARYGRTPRSRSRRTLAAVVVAALVALTMVLWVVFVAFSGDDTRVEATDTGHTIVDDRTVEISWTLTAPADTEVSCALQALDDVYGIVGWKVVDIPASPDRVRAFTETVRTSQPAINGLIYRCWLP